MSTLTIQLPGQLPVFHVLKDETITIGRMKGNTIVIEDSSISLMHAKITRKDGQFYVKDLNSTNGTMVNGQPIGEAKLRDHDKVRFAEITTQFSSDGELVTTPAPIIVPTSAPLPPLVDGRQDAGTSIVASSGQTRITAKSMTTVTSPAKKVNPKRQLVLVAAAIALIVLPGLGFAIWKLVNSGRLESHAAQPTALSKAKKPSTSPISAKQIPPANNPVEAALAPQPVETASATGVNVSELVAGLKSKDPTERRQAASALHGLGVEAKDAIPALKEALKDSDAEVQMWAALALVNTQTGDKAVIPILVRSLKNDNSVLRQVACLSLGLIPYEAGDKITVLPALNEVAGKDSSEEVRQAAKSALNIIGADNVGGSGPESAAK